MSDKLIELVELVWGDVKGKDFDEIMDSIMDMLEVMDVDEYDRFMDGDEDYKKKVILANL